MSDPLDALELEPDEKVLWHGRPGFGVTAHERRRILKGWWAVSLVLLGLYGLCIGTSLALQFGRDPSETLGLQALAIILVGAVVYCFLPTAWIAAAIFISKLVGGRVFSISIVIFLLPIMGLTWWFDVSQRGTVALVGFLNDPVTWVFIGILTVCVARIVHAILQRKHTHYYLTSARAFEVRSGWGGDRLMWSAQLPRGRLELRVIRPFGSGRRGHIAIGTGRRRRLLQFLEEPDRTLEDLERVIAELDSG